MVFETAPISGSAVSVRFKIGKVNPSLSLDERYDKYFELMKDGKVAIPDHVVAAAVQSKRREKREQV